MDPEIVFSVAGVVSMLGWLVLLASPWFPQAADRIAGAVVPGVLATGYFALLVLFPSSQGGFGSFAEITELFDQPWALMAGWIHFLAFDLVVGAWICRVARRETIRFVWVVPCLLLTFLVGPLGFLVFAGVRAVARRRSASAGER